MHLQSHYSVRRDDGITRAESGPEPPFIGETTFCFNLVSETNASVRPALICSEISDRCLQPRAAASYASVQCNIEASLERDETNYRLSARLGHVWIHTQCVTYFHRTV
jgi:hypothetical protein